MTQNIQVKDLADSIRLPKKRTFLSKIFRNALLKKFKNLQYGYIVLIDNDKRFTFGKKSEKLQTEVTINSQEFYVLLGSGGVLGVSEAFMAGYWNSTNLVVLLQIVLKNKRLMDSLDSGFARLIQPINKQIHKRHQNTLTGSKNNILAHYDLSNDFYKLWLDPTMTYSCGYFNKKNSTLESASIEKIDRICRKLHLSSSDTLLEIGTGWGSFSAHAAKNYGCKITTTTISDAQFQYAEKLFKKEGLESQINLVNIDYRNLEGQYDKIVSIEMIEAVGYQYIPEYFKKVSSLLKPDGLLAIQGITYNDQNFDDYKNSVDFIKKYIFPGSCLISLSQVIDVMKVHTDLALVDMEDITQHYTETLKRWRENFLNVLPDVRKLGFSEAFIKMWEFYFVFCEAGFLERNIGDVQMIIAKSDARKIRINY
ncbi:MAG: class I SAM-dependent methyltransferase [Fidelibacterota bacterium]|jgi:cyclopropane-fatty-acyl-phospholipid synthase|tara:strand:- start:1943 stop:3214 length:1272 start_codon:yes stop_codon:yes gene_type:complete